MVSTVPIAAVRKRGTLMTQNEVYWGLVNPR